MVMGESNSSNVAGLTRRIKICIIKSDVCIEKSLAGGKVAHPVPFDYIIIRNNPLFYHLFLIKE